MACEEFVVDCINLMAVAENEGTSRATGIVRGPSPAIRAADHTSRTVAPSHIPMNDPVQSDELLESCGVGS